MLIQSKLALGLSLLVAAVIALVTLSPLSTPALGSLAHSDKIYHALAFAGLVLPLALLRADWLVTAIPIYAAFGGLIEIIQPFVGRECSLIDWLADLTGLALGIFAGLAATSVFRSAQQVWLRQ